MANKYIYPSIFEFNNDCITVTFPDFPGCITFGNSQEEAFNSAKDTLELHLYNLEKNGEKINLPSDISNIPIKNNETIVFIEIRLVDVKKQMNSKHKVMTVKEFSKYYGINQAKCYEIVHAKGFPMIKFGKRIVIISSKVDEWLENNIGKQF